MLKYIKPPELIRRSSREDRYEKRVSNWISPWDYTEEIDVALLMIQFGRAALGGMSAVAGAPNAIREAFLINTTYSPDFDIDIRELRVRDAGEVVLHTTDIARCHRNMEEAVAELFGLQRGLFPIFIGGDHSISYPLMKGFSRSHPEKRLGLIHFDAHNDVRNLEDGGPTNGTPFRSVLESGLVKGTNMVQVGIHGFMNAAYYKQYLEGKGVRIFTMREIRRLGIESVIDEAIRIAGDGTDAIYVSLDIDVMAHAVAPGTAGSSAEGMAAWDMLEAMFALGQHPKTGALDLVCIDPLRDLRELTSRLGTSIILTLLAGYLRRLKGAEYTGY